MSDQKGYVKVSKADRLEAAKGLSDEGVRSYGEAKAYLERGLYAESVKAARSAMEKMVKGILVGCVAKYPKSHVLPEKDFLPALQRVRSGTEPKMGEIVLRLCGTAVLYSNMWASAYPAMEYGIQEVLLQPSDLFRESDARRALDDAGACLGALALVVLALQKLETGVAEGSDAVSDTSEAE